MLDHFQRARRSLWERRDDHLLLIVHPQGLFYDPSQVDNHGDVRANEETQNVIRGIIEHAKACHARGITIFCTSLVNNEDRFDDIHQRLRELEEEDELCDDMGEPMNEHEVRLEIDDLRQELSEMERESYGGIHPEILELDPVIIPTTSNSPFTSSLEDDVDYIRNYTSISVVGFNGHACVADTVYESWDHDNDPDQLNSTIYYVSSLVGFDNGATEVDRQHAANALDQVRRGIIYVTPDQMLRMYERVSPEGFQRRLESLPAYEA